MMVIIFLLGLKPPQSRPPTACLKARSLVGRARLYPPVPRRMRERLPAYYSLPILAAPQHPGAQRQARGWRCWLCGVLEPAGTQCCLPEAKDGSYPPRFQPTSSSSPPSTFLCTSPGSGLQVGIFTAQKSLCVDSTASLESRPHQSCASAWALPLRQLRCLHWPEGAACHGGSHLPGGSHRHRLQRPCRLLAAAALGHSLLGLPLSLC